MGESRQNLEEISAAKQRKIAGESESAREHAAAIEKDAENKAREIRKENQQTGKGKTLGEKGETMEELRVTADTIADGQETSFRKFGEPLQLDEDAKELEVVRGKILNLDEDLPVVKGEEELPMVEGQEIIVGKEIK